MQNKCGVTPDNITSLKENEIFVFGSNMAGAHGGGAALAALKWGAVKGQAEGLFGSTYALPTLDANYQQLDLSDIANNIETLRNCVMKNHKLHFLITMVGCGIAGFSVAEIAPLFYKFLFIENCSLPKDFIDHFSSIE